MSNTGEQANLVDIEWIDLRSEQSQITARAANLVVSKERRKRVWPYVLAGALAVGSLMHLSNDQGFDSGAKSRQAEIARLDDEKKAADERAVGASNSANYFEEQHRVEVARSAAIFRMATDQELPYFKGSVEVYYDNQLAATITNPIILSPSFGALGKKSSAAGWQAIIAHSPNSDGGLNAYVADSHYNTYNFIGEGGVVLTDEEVWSAKTGLIDFDVMHLGPDVNGVIEILNSQDMIFGATAA